MSHATFLPPDLGSFCRLDELGLQVMGQRLEPGRAVLACRVVETEEFDRWCRRYRGKTYQSAFAGDEPLLRHVRTRVGSPQTNGVIEQFFGALKYEHLYRAPIDDGGALAMETARFRHLQPHPATKLSTIGPPPGRPRHVTQRPVESRVD